MITAAEKVKAIQDAGYRVYVSQRRFVRRDGIVMTMSVRQAAAEGLDWVILPHGGETLVEVRVVHDARLDLAERGEEASVLIATGRADCSPLDRFEKRKGLELAVRRAIAGAPELRAIIGKYVRELAPS